eukprot:Lithocolla_globosa_v1_NODE_8_length_11455_cov_155.660175.p7 type:complete len:158 gc:universal NODE_8_length_11455_cov_155.660175:9588-9115(-)
MSSCTMYPIEVVNGPQNIEVSPINARKISTIKWLLSQQLDTEDQFSGTSPIGSYSGLLLSSPSPAPPFSPPHAKKMMRDHVVVGDHDFIFCVCADRTMDDAFALLRRAGQFHSDIATYCVTICAKPPTDSTTEATRYISSTNQLLNLLDSMASFEEL